MSRENDLGFFVRESLASGRSREDVALALGRAGWSGTDVSKALASWSVEEGFPPVPARVAREAPWGVAFAALLFAALGVIAWHLCSLGFALTDIVLHDPATPFAAPVPSARWSVAALAVFVPVFLLLDRRSATAPETPFRSRIAGVGMFVAALTILGDAVVIINALLSGDMTAGFVAKAFVVAATAIMIGTYYKGLSRA